ncbi:MAG TPA: hypothetical protein PLY93_08215 [Turneriella sp.]|nr:hypothetical protein [Turneriella sp.]
MPQNRVQILFNELEAKFAETEKSFLHAEALRHRIKGEYEAILEAVRSAKKKFHMHPRATLVRRLSLMETLLSDLLLRSQGERRSFDALGFLLSRLRSNLASEILEPKLYQKIRNALEEEENFKRLRAKYPDSEAVITHKKNTLAIKEKESASKVIRLMLISHAGIHYAIPVKSILKKTNALSPVAAKMRDAQYTRMPLPVNGQKESGETIAVFFIDLKGKKCYLHCDSYFTPVEIAQKILKKMLVFTQDKIAGKVEHRPFVSFYGRRFFVYGARLSYTIRTGVRNHTHTSHE